MSTEARSKRLFRDLQWILILLHVTVIDCRNANIAASNTTLTLGQSVTLTCSYNGSGTETTVLWYKGTFSQGISLSLKPNTTVPGTCYVFTASTSFNTTRVSYSCNSATKTYTLQIGQVQQGDLGIWSCTFQDPFVDSSTAEITLSLAETTTPPIGSNGNNEGETVGIVCDAFGIAEVIVGVYLLVVYKLYTCNGPRKEAFAVIANEVLGFVQIALGSYLIYSKSQGLTPGVIAGIILVVIGFPILAAGVYFIFQYHWSKCNGNEVKNEETSTVVRKSKTDGKRQGENRGKPDDDTRRKQLPPSTHLRTQNNIELETQRTTFDPALRRPLPPLTQGNVTRESGQQK